MKQQKNDREKRLEYLVKNLNLGISRMNNFLIHHYVYLLVNENYVSEDDADYLLEDIYNNGTPYPYESFLQEDK